MEDEDPFPPDENELIHIDARDGMERQVCIFENDEDDGAPWILHEVASDTEIFVGLSVEQKQRAHDAIHYVMHESEPDGRSMFQ